MVLSLTQQKALAIVPKVFAAISLVGSCFVAVDVLEDKKKKQQTYSRLMLGSSCWDIIPTFGLFLSTWPIPRDSGVWGASGTTASCSMQGFFVQMYLGGVCYSVCLSTYFLLVITLQWSQIQVKKAERWMHAGSIFLGVGPAVVGLPLTLYNNANLWCFISSLPQSCANSRHSTGDCIRGDNAWLYRWILFYGPLWFALFYVTVVMGAVSYGVWATEKASRKYRHPGSGSFNSPGGSFNPPSESFKSPGKSFKSRGLSRSIRRDHKDKLNKLSHQVAWQAFYYVLAFYFTRVFATTVRLMQTLNREVPYTVILLFAITAPMQGFLNALVYVRPRYIRFRQRHPDYSFWRAFFKTIRTTVSVKKPSETDCLSSTTSCMQGDHVSNEYTMEEDARVMDPANTLQETRERFNTFRADRDDAA